MALKFWCNKCGNMLLSENKITGILVTCDRCGNQIEVPSEAIDLGRSSWKKRKEKKVYRPGSRGERVFKKYKRIDIFLWIIFTFIIDNVLRFFVSGRTWIHILSAIIAGLVAALAANLRQQEIESIPESQRDTPDYSANSPNNSKDKARDWQRRADISFEQRKKKRQ